MIIYLYSPLLPLILIYYHMLLYIPNLFGKRLPLPFKMVPQKIISWTSKVYLFLWFIVLKDLNKSTWISQHLLCKIYILMMIVNQNLTRECNSNKRCLKKITCHGHSQQKMFEKNYKRIPMETIYTYSSLNHSICTW